MHTQPQNRTKILVIDDDKEIRELFHRLLDNSEYEIDHAKDGKDAIEFIKWKEFDIIFLDIKMPNVDGLEVLKKVRKIKSKMPVVVIITGVIENKVIEKAINKGAITCLYKPFDIDAILKIIRQVSEKNVNLS